MHNSEPDFPDQTFPPVGSTQSPSPDVSRENEAHHVTEVQKMEEFSPEQRERLWNVYSEGLGIAQLKSPFVQYMGHQDFEQCLDDHSFYKLVLRQDGEIVGILLLATDLNKVPWLSGDYFKNSYPEEYGSKKLMYYAGISIDQSKQVDPRGVVKLTRLMIDLFDTNGFQVFFHDYSGQVHPTSGNLGSLIAKRKGGEAKELDTMHFWEITVG